MALGSARTKVEVAVIGVTLMGLSDHGQNKHHDVSRRIEVEGTASIDSASTNRRKVTMPCPQRERSPVWHKSPTVSKLDA